jgi:hypothetical protein
MSTITRIHLSFGGDSSSQRATITEPTAYTGVDISETTYGFLSSAPPNPTIKVCVYGLNADDAAVIQLESSVNFFSSDTLVHQAWTATGPIGAGNSQGGQEGQEGTITGFFYQPENYSVRGTSVADIPWGVEDATLRINVSSLTGTNPSLTFEAWVEFSYNSAGVPI